MSIFEIEITDNWLRGGLEGSTHLVGLTKFKLIPFFMTFLSFSVPIYKHLSTPDPPSKDKPKLQIWNFAWFNKILLNIQSNFQTEIQSQYFYLIFLSFLVLLNLLSHFCTPDSCIYVSYKRKEKCSIGLFKINLKYLDTDKMGDEVVKSKLDTFKGP